MIRRPKVPRQRRLSCKTCGVKNSIEDLNERGQCLVCQSQPAIPGLEGSP